MRPTYLPALFNHINYYNAHSSNNNPNFAPINQPLCWPSKTESVLDDFAFPRALNKAHTEVTYMHAQGTSNVLNDVFWAGIH